MGSRSQGRAWGRTRTSYSPAPGSLQLSHHRPLPVSPSASRVRGVRGWRWWVRDWRSLLAGTPARDYISQHAALGGGRACALWPVMER